jgi:glycosyltransferase involved in cell wall biosynthesis
MFLLGRWSQVRLLEFSSTMWISVAKKVAIFIPGNKLFGQERALINLAEELRDDGNEIIIVLHSTWGDAIERYVSQRGFQSVSLPLNTIWSLSTLIKNPITLFKNVACIWRSSRKMSKIRKKEGVEVIIASNWAFTLYIVPSIVLSDMSLVYRHGDAPSRSNVLARIIARTVFSVARYHVVNSEFVRRKLIEFYRPKNLKLIRNFPYTSAAVKADGKGEVVAKKIVFAGQLAEHKGVSLLLEAFDLLAEEVLSVSLVVAGSEAGVGTGRTAMMAQLDRSIGRWGERVKYVGHVEGLSAILTRDSILVCPSVWDDPSPNVILEAKAMGIPAIGFARGGHTRADPVRT